VFSHGLIRRIKCFAALDYEWNLISLMLRRAATPGLAAKPNLNPMTARWSLSCDIRAFCGKSRRLMLPDIQKLHAPLRRKST
jgi:hypothetical protein